MLKKLLYWYAIPLEPCEPPVYVEHWKSMTTKCWNIHVSVEHVCKKLGRGLKQYYADLIMLELLERGEL